MNFLDALQANDTFTENLMPTHSTSGSYLLDMFFQMGGSRDLHTGELVAMLAGALSEDVHLATKAVFYNRDVRGGQGERRSFRVFFRYLAYNFPEIARKNIENVPYYGRWDDLLFGTLDTPVEKDALDYILFALKSGDRLCAKWMPREHKSLDRVAKKLMAEWKLTPKEYRQLLSGNTQVVENLMCANRWREINYEHVPSVASHKYRNAFKKHDPAGYSEFLDAVEKGEKKIHAGAIFPHTVLQEYVRGGKFDQTIEVQWKALPDYMPKGYRIMPICDVSGSMYGLPLEVCVSLGIYLAERNVGPYQNAFITFSSRPKLQIIKGNNLHSKVHSLIRTDWDMNTNFEAALRLILNQAQAHNVLPEDMPQTLLILSDMQFDQCVKKPTDNALSMLKRMYAESGYVFPNIVFWNLRTSYGVPVKFDSQGTALVSGFSPSILKSIFNGDIDPMKILHRTLESDRYDRVIV